MTRSIVAAFIVLACAWVSFAETRSVPAGSLRQLQFSPDGRYALAQDDSEVTVLTVQPFAVLFRIPAQNASDAQFTPDSRQVLFVSGVTRVDSLSGTSANSTAPVGRWSRADPYHTLAPNDPPVDLPRLVSVGSTAHLERWSIADRARAVSVEIPWRACGTEGLSPEGRLLACVDSEGTLRLVDVASTETVLQRNHFGRSSFSYMADPSAIRWNRLSSSAGVRLDPGWARMAFSPDGRFFVAARVPADEDSLVWDLSAGKEVKLKGGLKVLTLETCSFPWFPHGGQFFAFVAQDRLLISCLFWKKHDVVTARLVAFPSGKVLSKPKLPPGALFRASDPGFVLIRPFRENARPDNPSARRAAAVELATGEVIISDTPALDVFGKYYVAECANGAVGLYERGKGLQATVALHKQ